MPRPGTRCFWERWTGDVLCQELGQGAASRLPAAVLMASYGKVHPIISFGVLSPKS
uniref:Uncharacterized protein n=1 Tax=Theropithecus gelada TaxID=9565 RepID=A0A8D2F0C7_THEGE